MSRTAFASDLDAVLDDEVIMPVLFFEPHFPTGTLYLHTDLGTITTLGNDWLGVGDLGAISNIRQDDEGKPNKVEAVMSAIDSNILDQAINQNFFEREAIIYLSARNVVTGALVQDPVEIERTRMDSIDAITGGADALVKLIMESEMIDFSQSLDLYYSDNQLQTDYSGDLLFQYLPMLKDAIIKWTPGGGLNFGNHSRNSITEPPTGVPFVG